MEGLSEDAVKMLALHHAAAHPERNPHGSGAFALPDSSAAETQLARHELQGRGLLSSLVTSGLGGSAVRTWQLTTRGKQLAAAAAPPLPPDRGLSRSS